MKVDAHKIHTVPVSSQADLADAALKIEAGTSLEKNCAELGRVRVLAASDIAVMNQKLPALTITSTIQKVARVEARYANWK